MTSAAPFSFRDAATFCFYTVNKRQTLQFQRHCHLFFCLLSTKRQNIQTSAVPFFFQRNCHFLFCYYQQKDETFSFIDTVTCCFYTFNKKTYHLVSETLSLVVFILSTKRQNIQFQRHYHLLFCYYQQKDIPFCFRDTVTCCFVIINKKPYHLVSETLSLILLYYQQNDISFSFRDTVICCFVIINKKTKHLVSKALLLLVLLLSTK